MAKVTYKDAGVDLDLYADSMARVGRLLSRTFSPRVVPLPGGFAGLYQLDFASPLFRRNYQDPVLVSCTDGVGTKLMVATRMGIHNTVGIDLVAMSVNDALCCGAEPLFFLDYLAMSRDDPALTEQIVEGITTGCLESDCALLGGETAILPDLYPPGEYDLADFCVGVVERKRIIDGSAITPGDVLLGVGSSGLHSNGYSLARKIVFELHDFSVDDFIDELGRTVGHALLEPTRIYARAIRKVLGYYKVKGVVHGIAHITGGGLQDNLVRILPERVRAVIHRGSLDGASIFGWLQRLGKVETSEMDRVFNCGLGLVLVVSPFYAESVRHQMEDCGYSTWPIGQIEEGQRAVAWG